MRLLAISFILIAFYSCSSFTGKSSHAPKVALEDFFKNSNVKSFRISPNGKKIAALKPYKDRMNVFVRKLKSRNWTRLTSQTDRDISSINWKGSNHILFSRDFGGDENYHIFSINVETKKTTDLTPFKDTVARLYDDLEGVSDHEVLIMTNRRNKQIFDVYRLNVDSGELKEILRNPGNHSSWVVDHSGVIRMALTTDGVSQTVLYRKNEKSPFKKVITTSFKESLTPHFFDAQNKYVYATTNLKSNTSKAVLMNPRNAKVIKTIDHHQKYDISGMTYSSKLKKFVGVSYTDSKYRSKYFSSYYKNIDDFLRTQIPGKEVYLTSHNRNEDLFVVYAGSDRSKGMYYLYNAKEKVLSDLANPSPWIKENEMAQMKPIVYKSRDGLIIEGYLTLPVGKESAKNLPMIVNPHGGPWHRDVWGYNSEVQFLANRGYAVLQVNFRGSTGYGRKFWKSSFKQWGRKMQHDITDGVRWAINKGIADKDRICIYGASYGGYATLAGLAYTPELYRCGIDYVGVSNLFTFIETIPPYWKQYVKMLHEKVGHPVKDKEMLRAASPVFNVDKIKAPLFIAQGAKDPRVKKSESDQMVEALRKRGIEVPYMLKENEGHGFRNQENKFEFYAKMESFLGKHLN
jgi:dipeptidyl aminopeptidase/acylaminoacyl peptidase